MKVILMIDDFRKMLAEQPDEFFKLGKAYAKADTKVKTEIEKIQKTIPEQGKYLFTIRERFESLQALQPIPAEVAGRSFPEYAKSLLGGDELNNHAQSCANAVRLIRAGKITEEDYGFVSADGKYEALERTSRIITKAADDFEHPAVLEAAALLKSRPANLLKALKAILDRFVVIKDGDDEKTVFHSVDEAAEHAGKVTQLDATSVCDQLVKAGHLGTLLTEVKAVAQSATDIAVIRSIVHGIVGIQGALAANVDTAGKRRFDVDALNAMAAEVQPAKTMTIEDYKAKYLGLRSEMAELDELLQQVDPDLTGKWLNEADAIPAKATA